MLYSLVIDPLLHKLNDLSGVCFPDWEISFKLSVYAANVIVLVNIQKDIDVQVNTVDLFGCISSAKVNSGYLEVWSGKKEG